MAQQRIFLENEQGVNLGTLFFVSLGKFILRDSKFERCIGGAIHNIFAVRINRKR